MIKSEMNSKKKLELSLIIIALNKFFILEKILLVFE